MDGHKIREDIAETGAAFQKIGGLLAKNLPKNWQKAVYGFFLTDDGEPHYQLWADDGGEDYRNLMEDYWEDDEFLDETEALEEVCLALHKACAAAKDDWREMTFTLRADGNFSVDFGYDAIRTLDSGFVMDWQSRCLC